MIDRPWESHERCKSFVESWPVVIFVFASEPRNVKTIYTAGLIVYFVEEVGKVLNWKIVVAYIY